MQSITAAIAVVARKRMEKRVEGLADDKNWVRDDMRQNSERARRRQGRTSRDQCPRNRIYADREFRSWTDRKTFFANRVVEIVRDIRTAGLNRTDFE
jgi:hypothetical protein